jgi:hypothetical protein
MQEAGKPKTAFSRLPYSLGLSCGLAPARQVHAPSYGGGSLWQKAGFCHQLSQGVVSLWQGQADGPGSGPQLVGVKRLGRAFCVLAWAAHETVRPAACGRKAVALVPRGT